MERAKTDMLKRYGPNGDFLPNSWKEDSDKLFGPKEVISVWKSLRKSGLVPPNRADHVFVSPTANLPTHELAIWREDSSKRRGKNLFLVGDLSQIDPRPVLSSTNISDNKRHQLVYFRWDAENLSLKPNSVDVIWDRKGWIWHLAVDIKDSYRVFKTFCNYYQLLKPGGCLVLDANDKFDKYLDSLPYEELLAFLEKAQSYEEGVNPRQRPSQYYPGSPIGQYERSTVDQLELFDPYIWVELIDLFRIQNIGQGILRHKVLVKR